MNNGAASILASSGMILLPEAVAYGRETSSARLSPWPGAGPRDCRPRPTRPRRWAPAPLPRPGRPAPGSHPRSTGSGPAARPTPGRRPAPIAALGSIRLTPMYSPCASAGSISLVILVSMPRSSVATFISSSASFLTVSTARIRSARQVRAARRQQLLLHARRVHGVPVYHQDAAAEVLAGEPERVGIVPLLGPVVVHQFQRDAVPALNGRPVGDGRRRVADDDDHVGEPGAARLRNPMSRMVESPATGSSVFGS